MAGIRWSAMGTLDAGLHRDQAGLWRDAARFLLVLWAAELTLARFSSEVLAWGDVLVSALGPLALGGILVPALLAAPVREPRRRTLLGLLGGFPLAMVAMGIAVPILAREGLAVAGIGFTGLCGVLVVHRVRAARLRQAPFPPTLLVLGVMGAASSSAWLGQAGGFPPPSILLPILACWGAFALLAAGRGWRLAGVVGLAVCAARLPSPAPEVSWGPAGASAPGPDIVLLTVDTLRVDAAREMASYRRLARDGVVFAAAQAPAPWTLPSMGTLLTAATPEDHQARRLSSGGFSALSEALPTLPARLAARGYDTAAVVGANTFLGPGFGFQRGFQVFLHAGEANRFALPRLAGGLNPARPIAAEWASSHRLLGLPSFWNAEHVTGLALALLRQRRERPLFLWIHFFDCHLPYREADGAELPWPSRLALDSARGRGTFLREPAWSTPLGRATLRAAYRHQVRGVDRAIGRLLDQLGPTPPRGRLVVLTSDHGEEFFDHGGFEHGHALYQEVVAVPLAVVGMGGDRAPGSSDAMPVDLRDVAATVLRAAGDAGGVEEGRNLAFQLEPRILVSRNLLYGGPPDDRFAVREGRWKLIARRGGGGHLYDLEQDPAEQRDLALEEAGTVRRLAGAWVPSAEPAEPASLAARDEAALRALGYLGE